MNSNQMPVREMARQAGISVTTVQDWIYAREPEVKGAEKQAGAWWLPRRGGERLIEDLKRAQAMAGEEIRRLRLLAGFSQGELAGELEVNPSVISYWESEQRRPRALVALRLRRLLDRIEEGSLRRPGGVNPKIDQDATTRRERAAVGRVSITRTKRSEVGAA